MNLLFRLFLFLGAVVVVALFSALLAPYFIDWDEYTGRFEQEASRIVGQPVKVWGETELRLLPLPSLAFRDLEVGSNADNTPMMTADEFSMKAELFPFLRGEVRIVEMALSRPNLNLQVDDAGKIAWTSPAGNLVDPAQVNIERLLINGGEVTISGLTGGRVLRFDGVEADVSANSLIGPWRIDAKANVEGIPSTLGIQTGTLQDDGSIRLKIDASQDSRPYRLVLDGPVGLENDVLAWSGNFSVQPFSVQRVSEMRAPVNPLPVEADGRFEAAPDRIEIPEYRMEIGDPSDPYTITGGASINIGDTIFFRAKADGRQIDLDRIREAENASTGNTFENRITALRRILDQVPVPGIDGEINMVLPALVAGDTYIRDVSAVVQPFGESWNLRAFSAKFPGNTTLEASGRLGLGDDFGFDGDILLASRQPSGFAAWISGDVDPAFRRLSTFGIAAGVSVSERQASFNNMELRMDDALLRGRMQRIASSGSRPAILLKLQGNRVDTENLRAIYSLVQKPDEKDAVTHDLDIDVAAQTLESVIGGEEVSIDGVDAQVRVRDGAVTVERFNAVGFYGAQITSSGRIENLLSKPNGNMRLTVNTDNASQLLAFAKRYTGDKSLLNNLLSDPVLTEDTALEIELDTTAQSSGARGQVLLTGTLGGTDINFRLGFNGSLELGDELPITVSGTFENEFPSVLMRQMGLETPALELTGEAPGPMVAKLDINGKASEELRTQFAVQLPETNLAASGLMRTPDWNRFFGRWDVTAGSGDLAPYLILSNMRIPGLSVDRALPVSLQMTVDRSESEIQFDEISGQVAGNGFSGGLVLQEEGVARPRLGGEFRLDRLDLGLLAESVLGRESILLGGVAGELGIDGAVNFTDPYYSGYDADLKVSSEQLFLGEAFEGRDASLNLVMLDGALTGSDVTFLILDGRFSGSFELKNTQGTVLANARYDFSGIDIDGLTQALQMKDAVAGQLKLQGSVETTGKSVAALVANLSGNGIATANAVVLKNFDPEGFDQILLETGVDGYEIVPARIVELVGKTILVSETAFESIETPFSITRGKIRARNVAAQEGTSNLTGDLAFSLPDETLVAELDVLFDPGRREAIAGADPQITVSWEGPIENPERAIDTDRLESYLSLRAFEQSQRRVETLEANVIETQRLQQQIALTFARESYFERIRKEEIDRQSVEESRRLKNASRLFLENMVRREEELARERAEAERLAREEQERLEAERRAREEAERLEAERRAQEEAQRLEEEREAARQAEAERREAERNARDEEVPEEVQNLLQRNIMRNLENFLNAR